jgi:pyruvate-formate lyase-activating enzyme
MGPAGRTFKGGDRRAPLTAALARWGQAGPGQTAGRFYPIACVALEIAQRCNLDCTLCYLSDAAEMAHDVLLEVLFSRIGMIESHYGPGTSIQITGGDPTLRKPDDLEDLCRYIRARTMRSCLMTNTAAFSRRTLPLTLVWNAANFDLRKTKDVTTDHLQRAWSEAGNRTRAPRRQRRRR